ncbi:uncharacterized protein LOC119668672 [Teleopsis dalmanni]|uniref:uncharacterized protein LOC119668672 n=1 Tax=Teleopsis dalmanni TaxID=139649 RepID=UPI0018CD3E66|nr:uncharacterized protein LOC119668672 [Teleopsis dalmanni]
MIPDPWMKVAILNKIPKSKKFRGIFSYDVNMCSIFNKSPIGFNLMYFWINNLLKYSDMPKECPIKKGKYSWKNLQPEKESIPGFVVSGIYRIDSITYFRKEKIEYIANTTMLVDIKMK